MTDTKKTISFEEILAELSEVARNGEGTAKMQALRALMAVEGGSALIPEPLGDEEKLELLAMLMQSVGQVAVGFAYRRAFPRARDPLAHVTPLLKLDDMDFNGLPMPETLTQLYAMFPEVKRSGMPPGFPQRGSIEKKKAWCIKEAKKIYRDRAQAKLKEASDSDRGANAP